MTRGGIFFRSSCDITCIARPLGLHGRHAPLPTTAAGSLILAAARPSAPCLLARVFCVGVQPVRQTAQGGVARFRTLEKRRKFFRRRVRSKKFFYCAAAQARRGETFSGREIPANGFVRNLPQAEREPLFRLRLARLPGKRAKRQRLYPGIALAGKCAVREAR